MNIIKKLKNISRIEYINYAILLYAVSLSFTPQVRRVIVILLILLWITDRSQYSFKLPKTNIFTIFGIFLGYCLLSYFWSDASLYDSIKYIKRYWYFIPIFIIFKYLKKEYSNYALSFFLLGMLLSEIISYGNFFAFWQVGLGSSSDPTVFMQHTLYSIFLSITAILLMGKIIYENNNKNKIMYIIFFTTVTINLLVNAGRTGYFTLFITVFIIMANEYRMNLKVIATTFVAVVLVLYTAYNLSPNFHTRTNLIKEDIIKVVDNSNYSTSIGSRIGLFVVAKEIFKEYPLFGTGIANNIHKKNEYITKNNLKNFSYVNTLVHFHNSFLEILTQFGIVGLSLFFYQLYLIGKIKIKDKVIKILKIGTLSIFLIGSMTDMLFYLNSTMSLFAFIVGIILAKYKIEYQDSLSVSERY